MNDPLVGADSAVQRSRAGHARRDPAPQRPAHACRETVRLPKARGHRQPRLVSWTPMRPTETLTLGALALPLLLAARGGATGPNTRMEVAIRFGRSAPSVALVPLAPASPGSAPPAPSASPT